jgi:hypothetical protein
MINARISALMDMTAEPAAHCAAIVAAHALAFLVLAYLVTLLRYGRRKQST